MQDDGTDEDTRHNMVWLDLVLVSYTETVASFKRDDGSVVQLPRSECFLEHWEPLELTDDVGNFVRFSVPTWLAMEEGLI